MTIDPRTQRAAQLLLDARATGKRLPELPADARPRSAGEAYAVQDAIVRAVGPIAAWKVGARSPSDEPACAPICAPWLVRSPARFAAGTFALNGVEAELAFTLARDLPPRASPYTGGDVAAAIASVHAAIEVVESRYADFRAVDAPSLLAVCASHGARGGGAGTPLPASFDVRAQAVELDVDGASAVRDRDSNAAGEPLRLLAWLANHAAARVGGLRKGAVVTTGTWTGLTLVPQGAPVCARFPGIGEARVN
jgi:2-keto-4-pentenoate hydratase